MTVEQLDVIDFIAIHPKTDEVVLVVTDHLEWTPDVEMEHMYLLQEKINAYLGAIESGELYEVYPKAQGRKIAIKVMMKFPLSDKAKRFGDLAASFVRNVGCRMEFELVGD